ncbi:MAG: DUF1801 domain-containing protein [Candidatus Geothermincolia bacterium]
MQNKKSTSVDEYLEGVPEKSRDALERLRKVIQAAAPDAAETISYQMPIFKYKGPLVGFAAFKDHLSFFVMGTAVMDAHKDELAAYDTSRGTIRFKPDKPLPAALVKKLVKARVQENEARSGKRPRPQRRERYPMPDYVKRELEDRGLMNAYLARPPYQQNDYIGWITGARQEATRLKRLDQMLDELERGDAYMKMAYKPGKP